jgi:hypothetical protein
MLHLLKIQLKEVYFPLSTWGWDICTQACICVAKYINLAVVRFYENCKLGEEETERY